MSLCHMAEPQKAFAFMTEALHVHYIIQENFSMF